MYVNTLSQCSPASVGLAQARPNYTIVPLCNTLPASFPSVPENKISCPSLQPTGPSIMSFLVRTKLSMSYE